jgi:hypothetical protein
MSRTKAETMGVLLTALLVGTIAFGAVNERLTGANKKKIKGIAEQALDTAGLFRHCETPGELKVRVGRIYTGELADQIYQRSLPQLGLPTDWPTNELKEINLERDGKNVVADINYIERGMESERSHERSARLHFQKESSGWRIYRQEY